MKKSRKSKLNDHLAHFLFNQIANDPEYQSWSDDFEMPNYITDNLSKPLRDYQIEAVKHFIYLFENGQMQKAKHILFNMATGTGKTLTMTAIVLYLYEWGYRNFVFLVHQVQIKQQAMANFTNPNFEKFLFKNPVKFNGKVIPIKAIERFTDARRGGINFMFISTQMLYARINNPKENGISAEDFIREDTIIIADEAHRLNVDTKKKKELEEENNWEKTVQTILHANQKNLLLEFTATVDLKNENIRKKYQDKLLYKYDFLQFNKDGYSKEVAFLYNDETQIADQRRLLIVNAVAMSEYRRLYAKRTMSLSLNPIILVKSIKIAQSKEDREFFHKVINTLREEDFIHLRQMAKQSNDLFDDSNRFIAQMFAWLDSKQSHFLGLSGFINLIKEQFSENHTMIYNSKDKERADLLPLLDSPRNTIRVIFSVNALNEGWDVLSLFDIIHFDISPTKKVSLQDIQLIGRGARLFPYELPKSYQNHDDDLFMSLNSYQFDKYKRKFDNAPDDNGRILETFYYHFVKTGVFLDQLRQDLMGEGIITEGVAKKTINLKPQFLNSKTYKNGFVLVNSQEYRSKNKDGDIEATFNRQIIARNYQVQSRILTDKQNNQKEASLSYKNIKITPEYFSEHLLRKALILAENNFFRLANLKKHIIGISSIDEMINDYLPRYEVKYAHIKGKDITELSSQEKLQLLVNSILPEVRKSIDKNMPLITGSHIFKPKSLSEVFQKQKHIYLVAYPILDEITGKKTHITPDERGKAQSTHDKPELNYDVMSADWYVYDENYGTSKEKRFVKFIASQIEELKQKYQSSEIYLIRNELDYYLFDIESGRRFSPDYLMIINDIQNQSLYYQCLFEPKGSHLLDKDKWKEDALIAISQNIQITLDNIHGDNDHLQDIIHTNYHEIKCLGFKFFNSGTKNEADFNKDFHQKL